MRGAVIHWSRAGLKKGLSQRRRNFATAGPLGSYQLWRSYSHLNGLGLPGFYSLGRARCSWHTSGNLHGVNMWTSHHSAMTGPRYHDQYP